MQNITNEVCLLLKRIFTEVTNFSGTRLRTSQKLRRINSIELNHVLLHCTCLRVFFCAERLKIDANLTNFEGWLPLHLFYSSI